MPEFVSHETVSDLVIAHATERLAGELASAALVRLHCDASSPLSDSLRDYLSVHLDEEVSGKEESAAFRAEINQAVASCSAMAIQSAAALVGELVVRKERARSQLLAQEAEQHRQAAAAAQAEEQTLRAKYEGKTLRCLRTARGWSRTDVVARAKKYGGLCPATYSNLESGFSTSGKQRRTSHVVVAALAKAFGVSIKRMSLAIDASYQLRANNPADPKLGPGRRRRRNY